MRAAKKEENLIEDIDPANQYEGEDNDPTT